MINITIQSLNNKTIEFYNLDNSSIISNITNNQAYNLSYNNYLVKITTNASSLSFDNFFGNMISANKDISFLILLVIVICIIYGGYLILSKVNK